MSVHPEKSKICDTKMAGQVKANETARTWQFVISES